MGPYHRPNRANDTSTLSSTAQAGRDLRYQEAMGQKSTGHANRAKLIAALHLQAATAKAMGLSGIPAIHGQMGEADIATATKQLNTMMAGKTGSPAKPAAPAAAAKPIPSAADIASLVATTPQAGVNPNPGAGVQRAAVGFGNTAAAAIPQIPRAAAPAAAPMSQNPFGAVRTGNGLEVAATNPDGTPMTQTIGLNAGKPRYVSTLPNRVPRPAESRVIDTGVGRTDMRGQTPMQTTGGTVIEYDPLKDMGMSKLPKGDPLLKGADRGVIIDPKYRTPGASPIGTGTGDTLAQMAPQPAKPAAPVTPAAPTAPAAPAPAVPTDPSIIASKLPKGQIQPDPLMDLSPTSPPTPTASGAGPMLGFGGGLSNAVSALDSLAPPKPDDEERKRRSAGYAATSF